MKKKLLPVVVLGLVLLNAGAALADGDIYVGGPWGTKITSLPYEIKTPGAYYLGGNLSYAGSGDGITIDTGVNHVTLDLMGFTLNGSGSGRYGIYLNESKNVEIRNGSVSGWNHGIREEGPFALAHRIINVRVVGNNEGIYLAGTGHLVKGCEVTSTTNQFAIAILNGGMVTGCTVRIASGGIGITVGCGIVSGNVVIDSSNAGYGIQFGNTGAVVRGNQMSGCIQGIGGLFGSGTVIGNTVNTANGTKGIYLPDITPNVLDQNTVLGPGTPYEPSSFSNAARRSNYPEASSP
jgi:hypothetical protein